MRNQWGCRGTWLSGKDDASKPDNLITEQFDPETHMAEGERTPTCCPYVCCGTQECVPADVCMCNNKNIFLCFEPQQ